MQANCSKIYEVLLLILTENGKNLNDQQGNPNERNKPDHYRKNHQPKSKLFHTRLASLRDSPGCFLSRSKTEFQQLHQLRDDHKRV